MFFIVTESNSITLSLRGIRMIVIPLSNGIACGITINKKVFYAIVLQNNKNYKKQHEKDQQTKIKNLEINFTAKDYKIKYLIKMNMNL